MRKLLLGHLVLRFASSPENVATEALAFILDKSPTTRHELSDFLRASGVKLPDDLVFRTQVVGNDATIPDLVGSKADWREFLIVESKFWAGLTGNQPVSYLKRLSRHGGGLLLFVAPEQRRATLWPKLLRRCADASLEITERPSHSEAIHLKALVRL